ncbi:hypothetical protein HK104_003093 [Borealophlyctis nickersoniae]|nr:hypothetical protein HK104_003093 [Borealophlyctis nickersoniae]
MGGAWLVTAMLVFLTYAYGWAGLLAVAGLAVEADALPFAARRDWVANDKREVANAGDGNRLSLLDGMPGVRITVPIQEGIVGKVPRAAAVEKRGLDEQVEKPEGKAGKAEAGSSETGGKEGSTGALTGEKSGSGASPPETTTGATTAPEKEEKSAPVREKAETTPVPVKNASGSSEEGKNAPIAEAEEGTPIPTIREPLKNKKVDPLPVKSITTEEMPPLITPSPQPSFSQIFEKPSVDKPSELPSKTTTVLATEPPVESRLPSTTVADDRNEPTATLSPVQSSRTTAVTVVEPVEPSRTTPMTVVEPSTLPVESSQTTTVTSNKPLPVGSSQTTMTTTAETTTRPLVIPLPLPISVPTSISLPLPFTVPTSPPFVSKEPPTMAPPVSETETKTAGAPPTTVIETSNPPPPSTETAKQPPPISQPPVSPPETTARPPVNPAPGPSPSPVGDHTEGTTTPSRVPRPSHPALNMGDGTINLNAGGDGSGGGHASNSPNQPGGFSFGPGANNGRGGGGSSGSVPELLDGGDNERRQVAITAGVTVGGIVAVVAAVGFVVRRRMKSLSESTYEEDSFGSISSASTGSAFSARSYATTTTMKSAKSIKSMKSMKSMKSIRSMASRLTTGGDSMARSIHTISNTASSRTKQKLMDIVDVVKKGAGPSSKRPDRPLVPSILFQPPPLTLLNDMHRIEAESVEKARKSSDMPVDDYIIPTPPKRWTTATSGSRPSLDFTISMISQDSSRLSGRRASDPNIHYLHNPPVAVAADSHWRDQPAHHHQQHHQHSSNPASPTPTVPPPTAQSIRSTRTFGHNRSHSVGSVGYPASTYSYYAYDGTMNTTPSPTPSSHSTSSRSVSHTGNERHYRDSKDSWSTFRNSLYSDFSRASADLSGRLSTVRGSADEFSSYLLQNLGMVGGTNAYNVDLENGSGAGTGSSSAAEGVRRDREPEGQTGETEAEAASTFGTTNNSLGLLHARDREDDWDEKDDHRRRQTQNHTSVTSFLTVASVASGLTEGTDRSSASLSKYL